MMSMPSDEEEKGSAQLAPGTWQEGDIKTWGQGDN